MATTAQAPVVVTARQHSLGLNVSELWRYRELLYFLAWRDVKVRYKQTALGAAWGLIQPLALMLIFTAFLGRLEGVRPAAIPYPAFALAGLIPWTLFAQAVTSSANSLISNQALLTKVYFPRIYLPVSATGVYLIDFLLGILLLLVVLPLFGMAMHATIIAFPIFAAMAVAASLSIGTFLAAINVRYRDVKYALPFVVQAWFFASPVAYQSELLPDVVRLIFAVNPLTGIIDGVRWCLFGGTAPIATVVAAVVVIALASLWSIAYFRRVERSFADVI